MVSWNGTMQVSGRAGSSRDHQSCPARLFLPHQFALCLGQISSSLRPLSNVRGHIIYTEGNCLSHSLSPFLLSDSINYMAFSRNHKCIDSMFVCHKQSRQTNYTLLQHTIDKDCTTEIPLAGFPGGLPLAYFQDLSGSISIFVPGGNLAVKRD